MMLPSSWVVMSSIWATESNRIFTREQCHSCLERASSGVLYSCFGAFITFSSGALLTFLFLECLDSNCDLIQTVSVTRCAAWDSPWKCQRFHLCNARFFLQIPLWTDMQAKYFITWKPKVTILLIIVHTTELWHRLCALIGLTII